MLDTLSLADHGPVIPVIVLQRVEHAVPLAEALVAGGVKVLEVTLRTPVALRCIEAIAKAVPQAVLGAGTLRTAVDAKAARDAGCVFGVSPGYTGEVGAACRDAGLPLLPGVASASEVMAANADGLTFLKFFPAVQAGGVAMLKALHGPFPDVSFCPTGGITAQSAPEFLALPNVRVCGGSWLTPADAIERGDWASITRLAREASLLRR
jgi:2-dehydro-3-deoxyphosphogluconate aldolase/(4S)-4-hydroxy-2-oxoglutarate aldolase